MKSWNKKQTFHNISWGECILTGLLALVVLATVLFPITDLDQITTLGDEIQYWGGAMSLLGQDWSHYIDGQAMISYGYSLVLLPICALFKNATFAYKAAIMLNGCFLTLAYLFAVKVAKRTLHCENNYHAILGSFVILLLPIFGEGRTSVGPMPLMILLFWICVNCICEIQTENKKSSFVILGLCIVAMIWLDVTMLAVFIGTVIYFLIVANNDELKKKQILVWTFLVLLGFCIGYVFEQICLYNIFNPANVDYCGSLQLLLDKVISNWTSDGIIGFIYAVFGKMYSLSINTFMLIIPAVFAMARQIKKHKEGCIVESDPVLYIGTVFSVLFFINVLYMMGIAETSCRETLMTGTLAVTVGPFLLLAYKELSLSKNLEENIRYVVVIISLTFITTHIFKNITSLAMDNSFGFLNLTYQSAGTAQGMIYYSAIVVLIVFILLIGLERVDTKWLKVNKVCKGMGILFMVAASIHTVEKNIEYVVERQSDYNKYQQVSDVLNALGGNIYFMDEDASLKTHISVIQMLANQCSLTGVNDDAKKNYDDVFITSAPYYKWSEDLEGYTPSCQVRGVVVWLQENDRAKEKMDEFLYQKEYRAGRVKGGKNCVYGDEITLMPGTYKVKFYVEAKEQIQDDDKIIFGVKSGSNILQTSTLTMDDMKSGKSKVIELEFGSYDLLENCKFYVKRDSKKNIRIDKVIYQKLDKEYFFGMNRTEEMQEIKSTIEMLDHEIGKAGKVAFYEEGMQMEEVDYIICSSEISAFYKILEKYTILYRNDAYTLLSYKDSKCCKKMEEIQGFACSENNEINLKTFLRKDDEEGYNLEDNFELESGDYRIFLTLKLISNSYNKEILGVYRIKNGENRLAGKKIQQRFFEGDICEISLPLIAYNNCYALHYSLELEKGVEIEVQDAKIKVNSDKYNIGSEADLSAFSEIVNNVDQNARVSYMTTRASRESEQYSLQHLKSIFPKCDVELALYDELMSEQGDLFFITRGYSENFFKLVSNYTMIAQEGKYILWAKSNGSLIVDAMKHGATMLSQGNKISVEVLEQVHNKEKKWLFSQNLLNGSYKFYINVMIYDPKDTDVLEVGISRDSTEQEIENQRQELILDGHTIESIDGLVSYVHYCGFQQYSVKEFKNGNKIITYDINSPGNMRNLQIEVYSWKGTKVSAEIVWIEKN